MTPDLIVRDKHGKEWPVKLWCLPTHYYSPIQDPSLLEEPSERARIWPADPHPMPGIDWREDAQVELCSEVFASQQPMEFPTGAPAGGPEYARRSPRYPAVDAWVLQAFLRHLRPARVVEVGAGYSSLVTARVNREYLDDEVRFTAIDPYPLEFLEAGVPGLTELRKERVQDTPLEVFEQLDEHDVLFVDTSHTVKTGGDVPWIFNQILPRLRPGVVVHLHDIFLPWDYPEDWVFQGKGWNEQYLAQSFLTWSSAFEVLFGTYWMIRRHWDVLLRAFPQMVPDDQRDSSALWIRRV
ncbi:MAG TPA: class I SAM-dependent methyltransferase [Solirubrobacterales bacterium]|nr:class I SAM-dependent methyltransferase [Solirubrobacterales bacterium]